MTNGQPHISSYIDHTILKPVCLFAEIDRLCSEAVQYEFAAVCVPPYTVKRAAGKTIGKKVKTATVIGFPMGYSSMQSKLAEIKLAMEEGADELDVVINISAVKNNDWQYLANEISNIMPVVKSKDKVIKVIIESGVLTDEEIIKCCELYGVAGIDYLKTSTGYAEKGATVEAVRLFRKHLPAGVQIKASGGIRDYAFARQLVDAGATRLGCSASIAIVNGAPATDAGY